MRRKLLFSLVTTCFFFGLMEGLARSFIADSEGDLRFQQMQQVSIYLGKFPGDAVFEPDPIRFWKLRPNLSQPSDRGQWWSGRWSNSLGFRNDEFAINRPAGVVRLMCFGDSTTFGLGSDLPHCWPSLLQARLRHLIGHESLEVINAGVPGYSSHQGLRAIQSELPRLKPDIVLATFGTNDSWSWDNHADHELDPNWADTALRQLTTHSRAAGLLASVARSRTGQPVDARWAEHANGNFFGPDDNWKPRVSPEEFAVNLKQMADQCRSHDCRLVLIAWPDREQIAGKVSRREPWLHEIRRVAEELNLTCVDLVPIFLQYAPQSLNLFGENDSIHVTPAGNQLVSDAIAEHVEPMLKTIKR